MCPLQFTSARQIGLVFLKYLTGWLPFSSVKERAIEMPLFTSTLRSRMQQHGVMSESEKTQCNTGTGEGRRTEGERRARIMETPVGVGGSSGRSTVCSRCVCRFSVSFLFALARPSPSAPGIRAWLARQAVSLFTWVSTSPPLLRHLQARNIKVIFWVANEDDEFAQALTLHRADGVMTDYPTRLAEFVKRMDERASGSDSSSGSKASSGVAAPAHHKEE